MGAGTVTRLSVQQAQDRYEELARRIPDLDEFLDRGANFELDVDDAAVYDELRGLGFLLGRG